MRQGNAKVAGLAMVLVLLATWPLAAQVPQPAEPGEEPAGEHVVRRGDTLWDLAGRYLGNPFNWPAIHAANRQIVADPHWIYPEQVLVIPGLRARVEPWSRPLGASVAGPGAEGALADPARPDRTIFYRDATAVMGGQPTVLVDPLEARGPVTVGEFYRAEFLEQPGALHVVGRVLRSVRELDTRDRIPRTAQPRDDVYVAYAGMDPPTVGEQYMLAEVGRRVQEAGMDVRLIDPRALVRVVDVDDGTIRVHIEEQYGRVVQDHVMLPLEAYPDFQAPVAGRLEQGFDLQGRILEFVDDILLPGKMARAFIDQGRMQGVQVGDVFEAYMPTRQVRARDEWVGGADRLPEEPVALLRVIRVTDLGATVVADEVMQPRLEGGLPVRRIARMP
jgi:hypothetical protein